MMTHLTQPIPSKSFFGLLNETLIVMMTHLTQPIPSKSVWFIKWNVDCYDDTLDTTNTK